MAGYVYRGSQPYITEAQAVRRGVFDPTACGTNRGYKQHRRHHQDACQRCLDAAAAHMAEIRRLAALGVDNAKFDPDKCGDLAGYSQHRNYGVPPCDPCRQANADYCKARRDEKKITAARF